MAKKDTEIAVPDQVSQPAYLMTRDSVEMVLGALRENLGGAQLSRFDFPRVTVPQGNGKFMSVPCEEDPDGIAVQKLVGVVVYAHFARAFWKGGEGDASGVSMTPPDCSSDDARFGVGDPGGECAHCPLSKFGTDPKGGKGQACKQTQNLYLLMPGSILPIIVQVPPTSLKNVKEFMFRTASTGRPYWTVEVEIALQGKVANGNPYNTFVLRRTRTLDGPELEQATQYAFAFREVITGEKTYIEVPPAAAAE